MREIKFRFWLKNIKEYVYWEKFKDLLNDQLYDYFNSKNIEVEQFTGLKDKNGKEIYEGDFIRLKYPNDLRTKTNAIILFDYGTNSLRFKVYESTELYVLYNHLPKYLDFEVIGNIHDNTELLKGNVNET